MKDKYLKSRIIIRVKLIHKRDALKLKKSCIKWNYFISITKMNSGKTLFDYSVRNSYKI